MLYVRLLFLLIALSLLTPSIRAQELEPRRWSHLPVGSRLAGIGYAYTRGDIFFNPVLKLEDVEMDLHTVAAKYIQTFEALGRSARIDLVQGYQDGK